MDGQKEMVERAFKEKRRLRMGSMSGKDFGRLMSELRAIIKRKEAA